MTGFLMLAFTLAVFAHNVHCMRATMPFLQELVVPLVFAFYTPVTMCLVILILLIASLLRLAKTTRGILVAGSVTVCAALLVSSGTFFLLFRGVDCGQ